MNPTPDRIRRLLEELVEEYPAGLQNEERGDVPRIAFNISLALAGRAPGQVRVCDIGGGIGLFSLGLAALGADRVVLVDDFGDDVNRQLGPSILDLHRSRGVEVVTHDVLRHGIDGVSGPLDTVTSFDCIEHLHGSPRSLLRDAVDRLSPGGVLVVSGPNAVNLRKRLQVPLGISNWSAFEDWYEADQFRGHVREPTVRDLRRIAEDLGLDDVEIFGRNWMGFASSRKPVQVAAGVFRTLLSAAPSLCSNIYVRATKRAAPA